MERLVVERIEEGIAVFEKEDIGHITVPVSSIGFSVREGDVLLFDGKTYIKDDNEMKARRNKLLLLQQKLKEKSKNK